MRPSRSVFTAYETLSKRSIGYTVLRSYANCSADLWRDPPASLTAIHTPPVAGEPGRRRRGVARPGAARAQRRDALLPRLADADRLLADLGSHRVRGGRPVTLFETRPRSTDERGIL